MNFLYYNFIYLFKFIKLKSFFIEMYVKSKIGANKLILKFILTIY